MFRHKSGEEYLEKEKKKQHGESGDEDASEIGGFTSARKQRLLRGIGALGLMIALPFFLWFILGLIGVVPSLVEVFGIVGLRTPAAFTVAGLLMAAIGFYDQ